MSSATENGQQSQQAAANNNFQPAWMRSTFNASSVTSPRASFNEEDNPLSEPIHMERSYKREDLLAWVPRGSLPPEGLNNCPYYLRQPHDPIVTTPLSDIEMSTKNINSSKAMSLLKNQTERAEMIGSTGEKSSGGGERPGRIVYGSGQSDGRGGPMSRGGGTNTGGWSTVRSGNSSWGSSRGGSTSDRGGSLPGAVGSGRGGGRGGSYQKFGSSSVGLSSSPRSSSDYPNSDDPSSGFGQRFAYRGRGTGSMARGASATASNTFNTRAQAFYDATKDIGKDRPRNRPRSTSDELDNDSSASAVKEEKASPPATESTITAPSVPSTSAWGDTREREKERAQTTNKNDEKQQQREEPDLTSTQPQQQPPSAAIPQLSQQQQATSQPPLPSVQPSQPPRDPEFYYVDPAGQEQGPFTKERMYLWFGQGYFQNDLKLRRDEDTDYRPLAELIAMNGQRTPFDFPAPLPQAFIHQHHGAVISAHSSAAHTPVAASSRSLSPASFSATPSQIFTTTTPSPSPAIGAMVQQGVDVLAQATAHPPSALASYFNSGNWNELAHAAQPQQAQPPQNSGMFGQPAFDTAAIIERQRLVDHQKRVEEEQRQREKEQHYQRMLEQKEAELKEKERVFRAQQEELARKEREMAAELERAKRELEERQRHILEEERRRLAEEARRQQQQEEENIFKRQQKLNEMQRQAALKEEARRLEEEQRLMKEAELAEKILRDKRQTELEAQARAETARLLAEEEAMAEKKRQQEREAQRQKDKERVAREREAKEKDKKPFVLKEAFQPAQKPRIAQPPPSIPQTVNSVSSEDDVSSGSGAWHTVGKHESKQKEKQAKVAPWAKATIVSDIPEARSEKTLKQIQEEEERQIRAEMAERERLRKEQEELEAAIAASLSWSSVAANRQPAWGSQTHQQQVVANAGQSNRASSSGSSNLPGRSPWGAIGSEAKAFAGTTNSSSLVDDPPLRTVKKPSSQQAQAHANQTQKQQQQPADKQKATDEKKKKEDEQFVAWFSYRFKKLYTGEEPIDFDFLVPFLLEVENPQDVEDYVVTYTQDSKEVKQFVKDFLQKRLDRQSAGGSKEHKDDLSSALVAPATGQVAAGGGGGKKKKAKAAKQVIDSSILGFRSTAASNRVNQGEIETIPPPAPTSYRR